MDNIETGDGKKIPKEILERYVEAVKRGDSDDKIMKDLGYNEKQYARMAPYFLAYFRDYVRQTWYREGMKESVYPLTWDIEDKFIELARSGLPTDKIARILNVPLPIVMDVWFKDEVFKARVDLAVETANHEVITALYRRAIGFEHDSVTESETETSQSGTSKEGVEVNYSTTSRTTNKSRKIVYPSVPAIELWLKNRAGWVTGNSDIQQGNNNKGRILEWLDEISS